MMISANRNIPSLVPNSRVNVNALNKRKQALPKPKPLTKQCDKCSEFSSNDLNEFTEHMKFEHNLDEIYPCDLCSFYTESLWDYQVHMEQHLENNGSLAVSNEEQDDTDRDIKQERVEVDEDNDHVSSKIKKVLCEFVFV